MPVVLYSKEQEVIKMSSDRQPPFWDCVDGRIRSPPCDSTVGFKFIEVNQELGRITVEFEAKSDFFLLKNQ